MARPLIDLIRSLEKEMKKLKKYAYKDEARDKRLRKKAANKGRK